MIFGLPQVLLSRSRDLPTSSEDPLARLDEAFLVKSHEPQQIIKGTGACLTKTVPSTGEISETSVSCL